VSGRLDGKVALITGTSRGLGRALVDGFLAEGARVAAVARSAEPVERDDQLVTRGDLANEGDVARVVDAAHAKFGAIDVLINNAAELPDLRPLVDTDAAEWQRALAVDLTAPFLLARAVVPGMKVRSGGVILNVSSSVGRNPTAGWGVYAVAKAGLDMMTELLALELKPWNIRVHTLLPRRLRTEMRQRAHPNEAPADQIPPEDVVAAFVYLASDEAAGRTGETVDLAKLEELGIRK
jgi:NAD(P)-dependent dehydrogenase (short-subunit alcohol dehydrogenase family)